MAGVGIAQKKTRRNTHKQQTPNTEFFGFCLEYFHLFKKYLSNERTPRCDGNGKMHPVDGNIWLLRKILCVVFFLLGHKKKRREQRYCIDLFIGLTGDYPMSYPWWIRYFSWHAWALIYNYTHPTAQYVLPGTLLPMGFCAYTGVVSLKWQIFKQTEKRHIKHATDWQNMISNMENLEKLF